MHARELVCLLLVGLVLLATSGCAVGRRHPYHTLKPHAPQAGAASSSAGANLLAVAVHDLRVEVRSGVKPPEFVGISRGGFGNPFDISTESGEPMAADVTKVIAQSLGAAQYRVSAVYVAHRADPEQVLATLSHTGASALLLLRIHELKSDTYNNTALYYRLEALVMNDKREVIGRALQQGKDHLGGSFWNPPGYAERVVPVAVERKLEELLNDPYVARALRGTLSAAMRWPARSATVSSGGERQPAPSAAGATAAGTP